MKMLRSFLTCSKCCQLQKINSSLVFTVGSSVRTLSTGRVSQSGINVFDRRAKLLQKERAAASPDVDNYDFMKEEVGYRVSDRVLDVARKMELAVDVGSGRGWVTRHMTDHSVGRVVAIELSQGLLDQAPDPEGVSMERLAMDIDGAELPFSDNSVDVVTSCLAMHWVNDLPGVFREINRILKPDGVFIGAMFGGETLMELRTSLQLAELEREGGFAPHVSPFVEVKDLGGLLNSNNFTLLTIDTDDLKVRYPSIFPLMRDLKGMGENNAALNRKLHLHRETMLAANAIYSDLYGESVGGGEEIVLPASFQVYYWIGWKPDPSQPRALKPQKSDFSLKDLHKLDEVAEQKGFTDITEEPKK
eukprot:GFUD01029876.1.p1 GENE.GFUD01029876.1~~GFUD01029876.1.p1  ORF type:complete len:361 (+),score=119.82 GFUD01029876.1:37-1119(+)